MPDLSREGTSRLVVAVVMLGVTVAACAAVVVGYAVRVDMVGLEDELDGELRTERHALNRSLNFRHAWQLADAVSFLALGAHLVLIPAAFVPLAEKAPTEPSDSPNNNGVVAWVRRRLGVALDVFFLKLPQEIEWGALQWLHIFLYLTHFILGNHGLNPKLVVMWFFLRVLRGARQNVLSRLFRDPNSTQALVRAWVVRMVKGVVVDLVVLVLTVRYLVALPVVEESFGRSGVTAPSMNEDYARLSAQVNNLGIPALYAMWQVFALMFTLYSLDTSNVVSPRDFEALRFGAKGGVVVVANTVSTVAVGCMFAVGANQSPLADEFSGLCLSAWLSLTAIMVWVMLAVVLAWEVIVLAFKKLAGFPVSTVVHYDCFLTHDWGIDENGLSNHERVRDVCLELKRLGLNPWFDEEHLDKAIVQEMCDGIDNSAVVVVFVTARYVDKVNMTKTDANPNPNPDDNCRREFNYAVQRKSSHGMVPVVMERRMRDTRLWKGVVGMSLGQALYVDMTRGAEPQPREELEAQVKALADRIKGLASSGKEGVEMGDMGHGSVN